MKSAYELALERLERTSGPTQKLTDAQKDQLAGIDTKYEARMAEVRLSFEDKMGSAPDFETLNNLRETLASELQRLEEKRSEEKDAVWAQGR